MKKNYIICGASKNLGKYLAGKLIKESNSVIQISRSFKTNIKKNIFKCDLASYANTIKVLKKINKKFKKIDGIVITIGDSRRILNSSNISTNFQKSFIRNFYPIVSFIEIYLKVYQNKKTSIVVHSSIAGKENLGAPIEYSVAKKALNFYCQIMAKDLAKHKIRLNIISPGNILMNNNNWDKKLKFNKKKIMNYISENVPTKSFVKPEEIYKLCKFLLDEDLKSCVGSNFVIDGGQIL
jgi:3-oxoacyl-[acyl-carrier protein] reductase